MSGARSPATVLANTLLCPPEELLWSKAFVMECGDSTVATRSPSAQASGSTAALCRRFSGHEAVLRAHLILFAYVYPLKRFTRSGWMSSMENGAAVATSTGSAKVCRGTYLSRAQYLADVDGGGYADARLAPFGTMSERNWFI